MEFLSTSSDIPGLKQNWEPHIKKVYVGSTAPGKPQVDGGVDWSLRCEADLENMPTNLPGQVEASCDNTP